MTSRYWQKITWILWVLFVVTLPFTTLPLVMKLTGSSSVAPASLLPLIPLAILLSLQLITRKIPSPLHIKPVLLFFLFALFTIALAFLRPIPSYKNHTALTSGIEGAVTLLLGLLFYLVSVNIPNTINKIEKTLRVINWTGLALLIWSILQVALEPVFPSAKPILNTIQTFLSPTRLLQNRMLGFAAEPSWLAHMLNLVFLAYWLAATLNRTSVHHFKFWKFTFENLLLALGVIALVGTLSRGGLLAFMLVIGFIFVLLNVRLIKWMVNKIKIQRKVLVTSAVSFSLVIIYFGLLLGGLWGLSKVDPRMATVFQFSKDSPNPILKYAEELQFGERIIYWQTGWNIFNDYPMVGVGVGFSGFYFPQYLPDAGWGLTETRNLLFHSDGLMNIKNLWSRLLAETGIIGFGLFLSFLVLFGFTSAEMVKKGGGMRKTLGFMGIFMLVALIAEEFSVDSFALPYLWFTMGLVTAAWRWYLPANEKSNG